MEMTPQEEFENQTKKSAWVHFDGVRYASDEYVHWLENRHRAPRPQPRDLYGVVRWMNGNPILDGMYYFETEELATAYALRYGKYADRMEDFNIEHTIITLREFPDE